MKNPTRFLSLFVFLGLVGVAGCSSSDSGGAADTGPAQKTCKDLETCCTKLTEPSKSACNAAVGAKSEPACNSTYNTLCGGGTDAGGDSGGTCGISDSAKVVTVTKVGGDAACPELKAEDLNKVEDAGTDAGADSCVPKVDTKACTASIDCTTVDPDGDKNKVVGSFAKEGDALVGTITVTVTPVEGSPLTCTYKMTLK
jgi:hypothetical protein